MPPLDRVTVVRPVALMLTARDWSALGVARQMVMLLRPAGLLPSAVRKRELSERHG